MKKIYFFFGMVLCSAIVFGQATYTWNQTGMADWTLPANWTPVRAAPLADDILVFDNSVGTTVINVPTQTIGQLQVINNTFPNLQAGAAANILTIAGGTGTDLFVENGSILTINGANALAINIGTGATGSITGNMNFLNADHRLDAADAAAITFNSPSIFSQAVGCTGNVFSAAGTAGAIVFATGSTFRQFAGANPFGLAQPASKVVFNAGSLFLIQQNAAPDFDGRTYANIEVNLGTFNQSPIGANPLTMDTLTITNGTLNINVTGGINVRGNISVAAVEILTFSPIAANTLTLNGTVPQTISHAGGTLTFGANEAIIINNVAGITLANSFTVNNLVTFTTGIVTIANPRMLTFSATASVAGASNTSFVNGMVSKIGNTGFVFPVGKTNCGPSGTVNGYAAVEIGSFTGGTPSDQFTAEYIRGDALTIGAITAPGLAPPGHISRCDYWTLTRDIGVSTVNITLSWNGAINNCVTTAPYIDDLASLTIARNDNGFLTPWDAMGEIGATTGAPAAGTVSWSATQSGTYGAFVIASTSLLNPLPISINYFTGIKQNSGHLLNWKITCNSSPFANIEMERSTDNRNYKSIYSIYATALRCQQPFDHTDTNPAAGINYYRLKMTDANGKITYSTVVSLLNANKGIDILNIAPNPIVGGSFDLKISAAQNTPIDIIITDMQGRVMQKKAVSMVAGFNSIPVNVARLTTGTYQLYGNTADGRSRVLRFVVQ